MSQRGGSVTSFVRWGKVVYSPLVGAGEVDVYLAFEKVEALRNLGQLRRGALAVVNMQAIEPVTVTSGGQPIRTTTGCATTVAQVTDKAVYVDGERIAARAGQRQGCQRRPARRALGADRARRAGARAYPGCLAGSDRRARAGEVPGTEPPGVPGGARGGAEAVSSWKT